MKNTILKVTLVLAIAFTYSCGGKTKQKQDDTQVEKKEKTDELHQSEQNGLVLNNGKPWLANSETTVGVENMQEIMKNFTEKSSVKAYETLSKRLKSEFSMVFEKCTMKGEAHNQLHNFLIPINDLFEPLASSNLKECQDSYNKLNSHLKVYQTYFK